MTLRPRSSLVLHQVFDFMPDKNFLIHIYLQPDGVNLRLFDLT